MSVVTDSETCRIEPFSGLLPQVFSSLVRIIDAIWALVEQPDVRPACSYFSDAFCCRALGLAVLGAGHACPSGFGDMDGDCVDEAGQDQQDADGRCELARSGRRSR